MSPGTLYLLCGKIAAGKTTLAKRLAKDHCAIMVSEDVWMSRLYGDALETMADYMRCSARLRFAMAPHFVQLLAAGNPVVLDFQANTRESRRWLRGIFEAALAPHELHWLDVPQEVCKSRLLIRNAAATHEFSPSEQEFDSICRAFEAPDDAEKLKVIRHEFGRR